MTPIAVLICKTGLGYLADKMRIRKVRRDFELSPCSFCNGGITPGPDWPNTAHTFWEQYNFFLFQSMFIVATALTAFLMFLPQFSPRIPLPHGTETALLCSSQQPVLSSCLYGKSCVDSVEQGMSSFCFTFTLLIFNVVSSNQTSMAERTDHNN